jgi:hypothetical protein
VRGFVTGGRKEKSNIVGESNDEELRGDRGHKLVRLGVRALESKSQERTYELAVTLDRLSLVKCVSVSGSNR